MVEVRLSNSRMLTTSEVAHLLHVHPNTVRHWANKGLLAACCLGTRGDRRFKREDLERFIELDGYNGRRPGGQP